MVLVVYAGLKKQNHKACFRAETTEIYPWSNSNFATGNSSATTFLIASTAHKPSHALHLEAANYAIEVTFQASEASHLFRIQKAQKELGCNT